MLGAYEATDEQNHFAADGLPKPAAVIPKNTGGYTTKYMLRPIYKAEAFFVS
jgi:hypothetical protein